MPMTRFSRKLNDFRVGGCDFTCGSKPSLHDLRCANLAYRGVTGIAISKVGSYATDREGNVIVYHAEKQRPKFKQVSTFFGRGPLKGQLKTKEKVLVKRGGWTLRVFKFPRDQVVSVKQHARHFEIVLK